MRKKLILNVIGLTLLLICLQMQSVWAATAQFSLGEAAGLPGETVTVPIEFSFSDLKPCVISVEINYDTTRLKFNPDLSREGSALYFNKYVGATEKTDAQTKQVIGVVVAIVEMNNPAKGLIPAGEIYKLGFDILPGAAAGNIMMNFTTAGALDIDTAVKAITTTTAGTITVKEKPNNPPVLDSIGRKVVTEGQLLGFDISGTDIDDDPLFYSADGLPTNASFNTTTRFFRWVPAEDQGGKDYPVTFTVDDQRGGMDSEIVAITVEEKPNTPPIAYDQPAVLDEDSDKAITLTGSDDDNDPLSYIIISQPENGLLTGEGANRIYLPNSNYHGSDSFKFKVSDGQAESNEATVTITINALNDAPEITQGPTATPATIYEDQTAELTVIAQDADGDSLDYSWQANSGSIPGKTATVTYTPADVSGQTIDVITVTITDNNGGVVTKSVAITVMPKETAPIAEFSAAPQSGFFPLTVQFNSACSGTIKNYLWDFGDGQTTVDEANPNHTYNNEGKYTVSLKVSGPGGDDTKIKEQYINVLSKPAATAQFSLGTAAGLPGETVTVPLNFNFSGLLPCVVSIEINYDTNRLKFNSVSSREGDALQQHYFNKYVAAEEKIDSKTQQILGVVVAIVEMNNPAKGLIPAGEIYKLSFDILPSAAAGDIAMNFTSTGTVGIDTSVKAITTTTAGTITVKEKPNTAPTANEQAVELAEDTSKEIILSGSDAEDNPLNYSIVSQPGHGLLSGEGASWIYQPDADYNGSDSFKFKVNDGQLDSEEAIVGITVTSVNDLPKITSWPTANPAAIKEDETSVVSVTAEDVDVGDTLTYLWTANSGSISGSGATVTYHPADVSEQTVATVTVTIDDKHTGVVTKSVEITVNPINHPPVLAEIGNRTVDEGVKLEFGLSATDADADSLTYSASNLPSGANFDAATRQFSWTPGYDQADTYNNVHFEVSDSLDKDSEDIIITVANINRAPELAAVGNKAVEEGKLLSFIVSATDPDRDAVTITASGLTNWMSFNGSKFTANPGYEDSGEYNVTFTANDKSLEDSETISIVVGNVNRAPILAEIGNRTVDEGAELKFKVSAEDLDNDPLTYMIENLPVGVKFDGATGDFSWMPSYDQAGDYSVTFKVSDTQGGSDSKTITITVTDKNQPPVANNQRVTLNEDSSLEIILTATDDKGRLTYSIITQPGHGSLQGTAPNLIYAPQENYYGSDSFSFKANDGEFDSDIGKIEINIEPIDDAPVVSDIPDVRLEEDSTGKTIDLAQYVTDVDNDDKDLTWTLQGTTNVIIAVDPDSHKAAISAKENWYGQETVTFIVNDPAGKQDSDGVEVTVTAVNDPPVLAEIEEKKIEAEKELKFKVEATDLDGDRLEFSIHSVPRGATIDTDTGEFVWKPTYEQAGQYEIAFNVSDGKLSDSQIVKITVTKEEIPPEGEIHINGGAEYTNKEDVVLTLLAKDMGGSGVELMQLSNGSNFSDDYEQYATGKQWRLSDGEGKKQVSVRFKDRAGNVSKVYSTAITLDETGPGGEVQINNAVNYTNNPQVVLKLEAADNLSGVSKVRIKNEGETSWKEFVYVKEYSWKLTQGDGTKRVYAELEDGAGNKSQQQISASIILDTTPPAKPEIKTTIPVLKNSRTNKEVITVMGSKEKNTSIIINGEVKIGLNDSENWTTQLKLKEGLNNFKITSKDEAGNESAVEELNVRLKTKIGFKIIRPNRVYVNRQSLIQGSLDIMVLYAIDDEESISSQKCGLKEGKNTVKIASQDDLGNEDQHSLDIILDTQSPQIEVSSHKDSQTVSVQTIGLEGEIKDTLSGVAEVKVNGKAAAIRGSKFISSINLSQGVNTIIIEAQDNAGNINSTSLSLNYLQPVAVVQEPVSTPVVTEQKSETISEGKTRIIVAVPEYYRKEPEQESKKQLPKAEVTGKAIEQQKSGNRTAAKNSDYTRPIKQSRGLNSQPVDEYYQREEVEEITPRESGASRYEIIEQLSGAKTVKQEVLSVGEEKVKREEKTASIEEGANVEEEKVLEEIMITTKFVKQFMMWRSYHIEVAGQTKTIPLSWELPKKQKLPYMLKLDEKKGQISGIVWGKGEFELKLNLITKDKQVITVPCKLKIE